MVQQLRQRAQVQRHRRAHKRDPVRVVLDFFSRQWMDEYRMGPAIQQEPGIGAGKVLFRAPHFVASNRMGSHWFVIDPIGHRVEKSSRHQILDLIEQNCGRRVRLWIVLEEVDVEMVFLDFLRVSFR